MSNFQHCHATCLQFPALPYNLFAVFSIPSQLGIASCHWQLYFFFIVQRICLISNHFQQGERIRMLCSLSVLVQSCRCPIKGRKKKGEHFPSLSLSLSLSSGEGKKRDEGKRQKSSHFSCSQCGGKKHEDPLIVCCSASIFFCTSSSFLAKLSQSVNPFFGAWDLPQEVLFNCLPARDEKKRSIKKITFFFSLLKRVFLRYVCSFFFLLLGNCISSFPVSPPFCEGRGRGEGSKTELLLSTVRQRKGQRRQEEESTFDAAQKSLASCEKKS